VQRVRYRGWLFTHATLQDDYKAWIKSIMGMILTGLSAIYFLRKTATVKPFGMEAAHSLN
jgi:hypothetical protein